MALPVFMSAQAFEHVHPRWRTWELRLSELIDKAQQPDARVSDLVLSTVGGWSLRCCICANWFRSRRVQGTMTCSDRCRQRLRRVDQMRYSSVRSLVTGDWRRQRKGLQFVILGQAVGIQVVAVHLHGPAIVQQFESRLEAAALSAVPSVATSSSSTNAAGLVARLHDKYAFIGQPHVCETEAELPLEMFNCLSKVNWPDFRLPYWDLVSASLWGVDYGGSIETFRSVEDLNNRATYISFIAEYRYISQVGLFLLRLSQYLREQQVRSYAETLRQSHPDLTELIYR
jgi:hypothetical protein